MKISQTTLVILTILFVCVSLFFVVLVSLNSWIQEKRNECMLYGIDTSICQSIITRDKT